jgi:hypothetical protein
MHVAHQDSIAEGRMAARIHGEQQVVDMLRPRVTSVGLGRNNIIWGYAVPIWQLQVEHMNSQWNCRLGLCQILGIRSGIGIEKAQELGKVLHQQATGIIM